jgi:hypothetical protein
MYGASAPLGGRRQKRGKYSRAINVVFAGGEGRRRLGHSVRHDE